MAMAHAGFVFLSMTKTGSTAVHRQFNGHAQIVVRKPPPMKHMTARTFHKLFVPVLDKYGFPRASYELVSIVRDPVDWTASWWKYRSRPEVAGSASYTGELSFDAFAEQVVAGEVRLGSSAHFVSSPEGEVIVDRIYRYEHLDAAVTWMAEKLGVDAPALPSANVSPSRPVEISVETRRRLEEHYAADMAIYESAI